MDDRFRILLRQAHQKRVPERNRCAEKQQARSVGLKINEVARQGWLEGRVCGAKSLLRRSDAWDELDLVC